MNARSLPEPLPPGLRILLAEDHRVNQRVALSLLAQLGCDVTVAPNGREALARVEAEPAFDAILMDCHMPVMDGYACARRLRQVGYGTPIIAITASAADRRRCLAAGMDGYLPKPFTLEQLAHALATNRGTILSGAFAAPAVKSPPPF